MKTKTNILMCIAMLVAALGLNAQVADRQDYRVDVDGYVYYEGYQNVRFKANTSAYGIKGDRFVFDEFVNADVYFNNMTIAPDKKINYDCYFDQLVFSEDGERFVLDKFKVDFIDFKPAPDTTIVFQKIFLEQEKDVVFMQILYTGQSSLYKRYEKTLVINDEQPSFNYSEKYANEYIVSSAYYVRLVGSENLTKLNPKRREILELVAPEHRRSMKQFLKEEKINPRKESDMVKVVEYYDSNAFFKPSNTSVTES